MLGPETLFGHNRYEDEDFRDTFLKKTLIMLAMRIFYNDPHFVISINILSQNQSTGKDDEITNMMLLAMSNMLVLLTNRDDDNVLDVKDANFVFALLLNSGQVVTL